MAIHNKATKSVIIPMTGKFLKKILPLTLLILLPTKTFAEGWQVQISDQQATPSSFLVIDKQAQKLHVLAKHSPLAVAATFPCTTGQKDGDKQIQDDLKTPEGIYFVGHKLSSLDYDEYGGIAYTLNYPNPVDRLRQKTGYGIWIHSKGHEIIPKETRGCIALNLDDLNLIGESLTFGYPVAVADKAILDVASDPKNAQIASTLQEKVTSWAQLWSGRSTDLFKLYDGPSYSLAQPESFDNFTSTKKSLFNSLPWIHTIIDDVQMLPGPGYWVTWFNQFYRAPNLTTEGVRRLYWQEKNGQWLIVGMEWEPLDLGMSAHYLELIEPSLTAFLEDWRVAWENGNAESYSKFYSADAVQGTQRSQASIRNYKKELWRTNKPVKVDLTGIHIATNSNGIQADMQQIYKDSKGYQDKGIKTLILQPAGDGWVITSENWRAMGK